MQSPRNPKIVPPGSRWKYTEPANGVPIEANHMKAFLSAAFKMREANGLYTGTGWEEEVLDLMCQQHPEFDCMEVGVPDRPFTLADIRRFGVSVANWIASGGQWVSQEEADRRSSICLTCPHNTTVTGCWGCHGIMDWLVSILGGRKTANDAHLHGCDICSCALRAKVHLPLGVIDNSGLETKLPEWCWMKEPTP